LLNFSITLLARRTRAYERLGDFGFTQKWGLKPVMGFKTNPSCMSLSLSIAGVTMVKRLTNQKGTEHK
jgi:hypothetical protein